MRNLTFRTIKINPNQTLLDLAIRHYGAVEAIAWILEDNSSLSLTSSPLSVELRDEVMNKDVVNYYERNKQTPATRPELVDEFGGDGNNFNNNFSDDFSTEFN